MRYLATLLAAVLLAGPAFGSPETGQWVNAQSLAEDDVVNHPETVLFALSGGTDSKLVQVTTPKADLCFDPDLLGAAGSARISVYRVITMSAVTIAGSILLPAVPTDNSDCIVLVQGRYWVEVTTAPTGGESAIVSITGRSN